MTGTAREGLKGLRKSKGLLLFLLAGIAVIYLFSLGQAAWAQPGQANPTAPSTLPISIKVGDPIVVNAGGVVTWYVTLGGNITKTVSRVRVTDTPPGGTTLVPRSVTTTQGTILTDTPTIVVDVGDILTGTAVSIRFQTTVRDGGVPVGTIISNVATIDLEGGAEVYPVTGSVTIGAPDLSGSSKAVSNANPAAGATITYTIVAYNSGTTPATGVVITDPIPANTSLVPGSVTTTQGTIVTTTPTILINAGTIAAGGRVTVTFAVVVASPIANGTLITNTAYIASNELAVVQKLASATASSAPVLTRSSKAVSNANPSAGATITYTITLNNTGTDAATGVVITDPIPANTSLVPGSVSTSQGTIVTTTPTIQVNVGTIAAGARVTVTFAAVVASPIANGTLITNTAYIASLELPTVPRSAVATASSAPVLTGSSKAVSNANPAAGATITYTIVAYNSGTDAATGVVITDPIPANTSLVPGSVTTTQGTIVTPTPMTPIIQVNVGAIAAGARVMVSFAAVVASPIPNFTLITNIAHIASNELAVVQKLASATASSAPVLADSSKAVSNANPSAGATITYTIVAYNSGTDTATGVVITDPIPANTSLVPGSVSTSQGTIVTTTPTIQVNVGTIAAGARVTVTFAVIVAKSTADGTLITNTAYIASSELPIVQKSVGATASAPNLTNSSKMGMPEWQVRPGSYTTYTIMLVNSGSGAASAIITDVIPAGTQYVTGTVTGGARYNASLNAIVWSGTLPTGYMNITFRVQVGNLTRTTITNRVIINDGISAPFEKSVAISIVPYELFLPFIGKDVSL